MTTEAYLRSNIREAQIWSPFLHSFPFTTEQINDRIVIYGLYSMSNRNQNAYLVEVEATDLLNIMNNYNAAMAKLTADEINTLAMISSRRYLAELDKAMHDQKLATKAAEIDAESLLWDAKFAALAADHAALETLATKVASATAKTAAKITELETSIEIEGIKLSEVEIDILEKEIQSAKADLRILDAANDILKIQMNIVKTGMELVNVDLQTAKTNNEVQSVRRQIARTDILENELLVQQARTNVAAAENEIFDTRVELADKKVESAEKDVGLYNSLVSHETQMGIKKVDALDASQTGKLSTLADQRAARLYANEAKRTAANFDLTTAQNEVALQERLDADTQNKYGNDAYDARLKANASIAAEVTVAKADIATTLKHFIQKK